RKALESLAASQIPAATSWEVWVIDNNSKDDTRQVAEAFCRRQPQNFRYVFEPLQGKSNALNRGIRESQGDGLAFIDDDVIARPDWLEKLVAPLNNPEFAGSGGRIEHPVDFRPPDWLALDGIYGMGGVLALFDRGREGHELCEPPYGTNMAFR